MPSSLVAEINDLKLRHVFMSTLKDKIEKQIKQLNLNLQSLIDQLLIDFGLKNLDVSANTNFSAWLNTWNPDIQIIKFWEDKNVYGQNVFININGNWLSVDKDFASQETINIKYIDFKKKLPNVVINQLDKFCKTLTEKTGLSVQIQNHTIIGANNKKIPQNTDDLIALHKGSTSVCQGIVYKVLSDDHWAVLKTRKGHFVVYYTTNDCGIGYDKCLMPEKSKDDFFSRISDNGHDSLESLIPINILKALKKEPGSHP